MVILLDSYLSKQSLKDTSSAKIVQLENENTALKKSVEEVKGKLDNEIENNVNMKLKIKGYLDQLKAENLKLSEQITSLEKERSTGEEKCKALEEKLLLSEVIIISSKLLLPLFRPATVNNVRN